MAQSSGSASPLHGNATTPSPTSSSDSSTLSDNAQSTTSPGGTAKATYYCDYCSKEFSYASNLRRHVRHLHGEEALQSVKDSLARNRGEKGLLACDMCPEQAMNFANLYDLRQHHIKEHGFKEQLESLVFDTMSGAYFSALLPARRRNAHAFELSFVKWIVA